MSRATLLLLACLGCAPRPSEGPSAPDAGGRPDVANLVVDWRDEVIYQLVTDRFADADPANNSGVDLDKPTRYHGGDFAGIEQQLPYLLDLGVTVVWISPVVRNVDEYRGSAGYHGYWTQDFSSVNPHFGDLASLRKMVGALHRAGLKVMLDIVTNHVGQVFFYDLNGNGQPDESLNEWAPGFDSRGVQLPSPATGAAPLVFANLPESNRVPPLPAEFANPSWYHRKGRILDYGQVDQVETGDFGALKDLRTSLPEVRDALFRVYAAWLDTADFDALRIDTVKHVEASFWSDFCHRIRTHSAQSGKRNFFQVGEALDGNTAYLGGFTRKDMLDSLLDYPQKFVIDQVFKGKSGTRALEEDAASRLRDFGSQASSATGLSASQSVVNFLDNHDMPRFLAGSSLPVLHSALAFLLLEDGIPSIYYGTEQEFAGERDPFNREDLWKSGYVRTTKTFQWIARLIKIRKAYPALRRGRLVYKATTQTFGSEPDAGFLAFERIEGSQTVLVALNVSDAHPSTAPGGALATSFRAGTPLKDLIGGDPYTVGSGGSLALSVPSRAVRVLVPTAEAIDIH